MDSSGVVFATPVRTFRGTFAAVCLAIALLITGALAAAAPTRAASPEPLKAVFIVGPAGVQTSADLADAEELATLAESYGMDVRRVFFPHATWDNVMANIQGANLVYYAAHGYGWPSPYTKVLTEARQDGVGLNTFDGSNSNTYTYYGANVVRANWVLAPNAVVFLNHDCYTAGNGEPGMAIPTWDVARQRVDNFAAAFLAVGAKTVFALSYQRFNKVLTQLVTVPDKSMEDLFRIVGAKPSPEWGWVGTDPRKFDSVRTPGATNFMDPHATQGFLRAVTGDLTMTGNQWKQGAGSGQTPSMSNFNAQTPGMNSFAPSDPAFFTPNGDGVTDTVALKFNVDREAFVAMEVKNQSGDVVRNLTAWSPGGPGSGTWNGKNNAGSYVPDGVYTVRATPHNRAGTEGNSDSVDVNVFTTMRSPSVSPAHFYAADGDGMARTTTLSVNLQSPATFWWKVSDKNGNVVRTFVNGVSTGAGQQSFQWDGKDSAGAYVPDGTYYSVTTTTTSAGTYFHSLPVDVRAFRLTTASVAPFVRGTKVKFVVYTAEPLSARPKVKVTAPGLLAKTYSTTAVKNTPGAYSVTVTFATTGQAGTVQFRVQGTDTGTQFQYSDFAYQLQ
jgi:flagellar hook assembly protein FlgD